MYITLLLIFLWMMAFSVTGKIILDKSISPRRLTFPILCITPALGMAVFILISTIVGWLLGMHFCFTICISSIIIIYGVWNAGKKHGLLAVLCVGACVLSLPLLSCLSYCGDFPYYQDAFTY